jgi:hypothetical protein
MGGKIMTYKCSMGKPEEKRQVGRRRCRWEDSKEIGRGLWLRTGRVAVFGFHKFRGIS